MITCKWSTSSNLLQHVQTLHYYKNTLQKAFAPSAERYIFCKRMFMVTHIQFQKIHILTFYIFFSSSLSLFLSIFFSFGAKLGLQVIPIKRTCCKLYKRVFISIRGIFLHSNFIFALNNIIHLVFTWTQLFFARSFKSVFIFMQCSLFVAQWP